MSQLRRGIPVLLLVVGVATCPSASDVVPTPQQLMKSLNESSSLSKVLPYQLTAKLMLTPEKDVSIPGQIAYFRDRDRERIEINVGEYRETRVRTGDKMYVAASRTLALPRRQMLETLEKQWIIDYPEACCLAFGKVEHKKIQSADSYCFVVDPRKQRPKRFCVDREAKSVLETYDGFEAVNFTGYGTVDGVRYPSKMQVIDDGKMFFEVEAIEVSKMQTPADAFTPPPNSQEFETCSDLASPQALHLEMPKIPSRWHSSYGSVHGLVQTDGSFSDIQVAVSRANPGFGQALKEAAAQWRFSPARCGSKAVVYEEQIELHN